LSHLRNVNIAFQDTAALDAFQRVRVSTPVGLFDSTFQYDLHPLLYYQTTANGGTIVHAPSTSSAVLSTAASAGSLARLQSKAYHRYIPLKSQLIAMTQTVKAAVAGIVKQFGYFDDDDGIFCEQNGTTDVAVVRRTSTSGSPVDNRFVQADWNLDNLLGGGGGTNPSGLTLDLTKGSILVIDLEWLSMGRVRIGFRIGGRYVYVHEFVSANMLVGPYMKTANLPVRWRIAGNGVASMDATCAGVISEGGTEFDRGFLFTHPSGSVTAASGARTCIIGIRPAATFNSIVNRIQIGAESFGGLVTGLFPVLWEIVYAPTITGGAWVTAGADSSAEYNITATAISGGNDVDAVFGPATASTISAISATATPARLPLTLDPSGANPIALALCATGIGGASACRGTMSWRELR
jgi:hypothetical protein